MYTLFFILSLSIAYLFFAWIIFNAIKSAQFIANKVLKCDIKR